MPVFPLYFHFSSAFMCIVATCPLAPFIVRHNIPVNSVRMKDSAGLSCCGWISDSIVHLSPVESQEPMD